MLESQQSPEKTPYERSVDDFFLMLRSSAATQGNIAFSVAGVLEHATRATFDRQKYVDRWAERHQYDIDGILIEAGGPAEFDEDGQAYENDNDHILLCKIRLASDVAAFVVASEHSILTDTQKQHLLHKTNVFLEKRRGEFQDSNLADATRYVLGEAVAPYIALDVERADMGDDKAARVARGRFVLRALEGRSLIRNDRRHKLSRNLRRARRN